MPASHDFRRRRFRARYGAIRAELPRGPVPPAYAGWRAADIFDDDDMPPIADYFADRRCYGFISMIGAGRWLVEA